MNFYNIVIQTSKKISFTNFTNCLIDIRNLKIKQDPNQLTIDFLSKECLEFDEIENMLYSIDQKYKLVSFESHTSKTLFASVFLS